MTPHRSALALGCLALVLMIGAVTGCAVRTERLRVPTLRVPLVQDGAKVFRITRVVDSREFAGEGSDASEPWLTPAEQDDSGVRSKIVGREPQYVTVASTSARREASDAIAGPQSILLGAPQDVERLVRDAVIVGFALSGYRVIEASGAGVDEILPIEIEIHRFWGWLDRDADLQSRMRFQVDVSITAPIQPLDRTRRIVSRSSLITSVVNPGARQWRNTIVAAGRELSGDLQRLLPASY
jgi:hypothetical protein